MELHRPQWKTTEQHFEALKGIAVTLLTAVALRKLSLGLSCFFLHLG